MIKYHPDTRFLTDYAAGSLPESQALCVAAHLHYCPTCRARVSELNDLGSELFMEQAPVEVSAACFENIMDRLQAGDQTETEATAGKSAGTSRSTLPRAIQKLTGGNLKNLTWRRIGQAFSYSDIRMGDSKRRTSLLHINAGGKLPKHHHKGDEITVILKGSFSDQDGHYHAGDYIVRSDGDTHTPVASQDEDCLCLATLDAPIVMKNWLLRLLMPLMNRLSV